MLYNGSKCEENLQPGNIWIFNENYEKYIHLFTGNAFTDIIQENETSKVYYTLEAEGSLLQWFIKNDENVEQTIIANVGPGYMFIDFKILGRLAVSNSKEIKTFEFRDGEAVLSSIFILHGKIVALPINEKILVALIHKDKIVILENLRGEKVINTLHTHKVGSILWFNYGLNKQAFLIVSSHHKLIEIFEYKSRWKI